LKEVKQQMLVLWELHFSRTKEKKMATIYPYFQNEELILVCDD
jgi:hypothetical protein